MVKADKAVGTTRSIEKPMTENLDIVMPSVTPEQAKIAWKKYQDLKASIVTNDDVQLIQGKKFLRKSYWRKVATFFNLTVEVIDEKSEQIGKTYVWHFTARATAPNGRSAIGTGSCDAYEKAKMRDGKYVAWDYRSSKWVDAAPNSLHNIRSTAETRAVNRAISNLVGGGEVSSDEIVDRNNIEDVDPNDIKI